WMSAPPMKLSFAEQMTRPRGRAAAISSSSTDSSFNASRENVLADSPCLSKVSQTKLFAAILLVLPRREAAEHLGGKRLVDLPVVDVAEAEVVALEHRRRRVHRAEAHGGRIEPGPVGVDDSAERLEIVLPHHLFRREHQPRGAVGDLRAVARR